MKQRWVAALMAVLALAAGPGAAARAQGPALISAEGPAYGDVAEGAWYYDAVTAVGASGILYGTDGLFRPADPVDRRDGAMALFALCGPPVSGAEAENVPLPEDVTREMDGFEAMVWAAGQKLIPLAEGRFLPERDMTREELVCCLYRYAVLTGADTGVSRDDLLAAFPDADQLADDSLDAMAWAVERGVVKGTDEGILHPLALASRAEAAQMIHNFRAS